MQRLQDAEQTPQPIDGPRRDHVELFAVDGLQQRIEAGPLVAALGAADAGILIDLDDLPARSGRDRFQLAALVAGLLFRGADPQIDSYALDGGLLG